MKNRLMKKISKTIDKIPFYLRKRFTKKYIVIQSDDWGMEQSKSIQGINYLRKKFGEENFTRWTTDSLETIDDLSLLFELLMKYQSSFKNMPTITANFITHNINYNSNSVLSFAPLKDYLQKNKKLAELYQVGMKNKILSAELHGYCHNDIKKLEDYFQTIEGQILFENGFFVGKSTLRGSLKKFRSEFANGNKWIENKFLKSIKEFYRFFKFPPSSIIPPHFIFENNFVGLIHNSGIKAIQATNWLTNSRNQSFKKPHFRRLENLIWLPRNARLDPHPDYNHNAYSCLKNIERAFKNKSPAIIDFHRVNIAGRFNEKYRDRTLRELGIVFDNILKYWPEVEFISTKDLLEICLQKVR
tara:strand:- start:4109 stop:5182 length:1074 start_codon:yes stop_codon:yes gene_type:complete